MPKQDVWDTPLSTPIALKSKDATLKTLSDARDLILRLSERHQARPPLLYATELLLRAAKTGHRQDIEAATMQLGRALTNEGLL
jgi:hypothetical protein